MRLVYRCLIGAGVSLMLAQSASAGGHGTVSARGSPRAVVQPNRAFAPLQGVFPRPVDPWRFWPPGTAVVRHGVLPSGPIIGGPTYLVGSGPTLMSIPPSYGYDQPPVMTEGAPQTPMVIEYPTGWYELRGDGMSTPYVWVWIPKPPPAPAQPPAMVPPVPPPPIASFLPETPDGPARHKALYRWVDEDGVAHWTDQRENIPQRYRAQAERR